MPERMNNPDTLKERLLARIAIETSCGNRTDNPRNHVRLMDEAAQRIDALEAENKRLRELEWLNAMPRAVVAAYASKDGCRDATAKDLREGHCLGIKLKAEMVIGMVGDFQAQVIQAMEGKSNDR